MVAGDPPRAFLFPISSNPGSYIGSYLTERSYDAEPPLLWTVQEPL